MSRIGKKPVVIPEKVNVKVTDGVITVKGPKGELSAELPKTIDYKLDGNEMSFSRSNDQKENRSLHGLVRALTANMIQGVTNGFSKTLDIVGVGYRAELKGTNLLINIGYSHPIYFIPPAGVTLAVTTPTQIVISGIDKQLVGQVAAKIRSFREPEPYKGKGIKYSDEQIRRKAGKTAGK
ncbi:MAG: 50S ribosomal protein L6 [Ignavibacteriaceae bacterium]|nr:50S ribosomal protein L6 [Ignavibacteriaceae bacterium]